MKIFDMRCGWAVEGEYIDTLPAKEPVTDSQMRAYFSTAPGMPHYDEHVRPTAYNRVVIQRPAGEFVIVPINPDVYCMQE